MINLFSSKYCLKWETHIVLKRGGGGDVDLDIWKCKNCYDRYFPVMTAIFFFIGLGIKDDIRPWLWPLLYGQIKTGH